MKQNDSKLFSSGQELANLVVSSDVLDNCLDALSKATHQQEAAAAPVSSSPAVGYLFHEYGSHNVLAFTVVSPSDVGDGLLLGLGQGEEALINDHFSFISTKVNPSFSIDNAAIAAFRSLSHQLRDLGAQIDLSKTLIITGKALAGSVASLFTLWLQHNVIDPETKKVKRPICVTFGSPLIGDDSFSKAISERPSWSSCFVHVVSNRDPIPRLFVSTHRPFGTYLFCSESGGCACFDDRESILAVMRTGSVQGNTGTVDYRAVLKAVKANTLYRGSSRLGGFSPDPLREGIHLQLVDIGALNPQDTSTGTDSLIKEIALRQKKLIMKKRDVYEPTKKLNDMKMSLTYMEWYMKGCMSRGGYYDSYKRNSQGAQETVSQQETIKHKRILVQYWKGVVEEKEKMPQKEGHGMRVSWLYGGTNYRRIVEPLDIAEYYKQGKTDYVSNRGLSDDYRHYKLLEDWLNHDKKGEPNQNREKPASLTEDSCFWAHVEEAIISLKAFREGDKGQEGKLKDFEKYIVNLVEKKTVSPDIFLAESGFMQWWREYKKIRRPTDYLFQPEVWAKEYK